METPQMDSKHWQVRTNLRPGDIGYLIYLHGTLYAKEYGWDCTFEGYVAESLTKSIPSFGNSTARLWIAENNGKIVGSIGIVPDYTFSTQRLSPAALSAKSGPEVTRLQRRISLEASIK
jgi:hypothetical protein